MINTILDIQSELNILVEREKIFYELIILLAEEIYIMNNVNLAATYPYFSKNGLLDDNINISDYIKYAVDSNKDYASIFSETFINFFSKDEQRDIGIFFTNNNKLIECLFDSIGIDWSKLHNFKILEPAVGAGAFIVPLLRAIVSKAMNESVENIKDIIFNISKNFYCIDINPLCTHITETLIVLELLPLCKKIKSKENNYMLPKFKVLNGDYLSLAKSIENNFDYVVGNPPYVTMYGRRSRGMTEEKRQYFNGSFDFVLKKKGNNKFNLCMFFVELGLKNLRNGGKLSFILDISFFEAAYIDLRKYLLENSKICSIDLRNTGFVNVASGQFILTIEKEDTFYNCQKNTVLWYIGDEIKLQNQYELYNEKNNYKFSPPIDPATSQFIQAFSGLKTLKNICPNKELRTCCALTGKTEEFIVDDEKSITHCKIVPYLEGSKGVQGKFSAPRAIKKIKLDHDLQIQLSNEFKLELEKSGVKNKKRVTLGNMDAYFYPKLFIRQSATELIATYTEEPFAANNSLYIMSFMSNDETKKNMLKYICGLLNSDILSKYAIKTSIIRMSKGKTPQIKISDLLKLPIILSELHFFKVISIVEKRLNVNNDECTANLDFELNSIVSQIYNI